MKTNISPQLAFALSTSVAARSKDGSLYRWSETHWQSVPHTALEREALMFVAAKFPRQASEKVASSAAATAILHAKPLPAPTATYIPTLSGYIAVEGLNIRLISHDPAYGITYVLDCPYDPLATCPMFDAFLAEALPEEEVRGFLQEYAGYTLLGDTRHQLAAWLVGEGGTGKGTFAFIMQALHRQAVALSLNALDGFKLAGLQSASLVCVDETPQRIDEQRLKTLISGDTIQIDRKYRDPITLRPTAKWIVNGNALPAISDHSSGFWRRWVIFPFNVRPMVPRPLLAETITSTELAGVLNWCLGGLQRLLQRGAFPAMPAVMQDALRTGRQQSNTVAEWVEDDGIEGGENAQNTRADVYSRYSDWCKQSNCRALSPPKFWERMRAIFPDWVSDRMERKIVGGKRCSIVKIHLPSS